MSIYTVSSKEENEMTKRIFIWVAHPNSKSLCSSLADAYQAGAERSGAEVSRMDLHEMQFDLDVYQTNLTDIDAADVSAPSKTWLLSKPLRSTLLKLPATVY